MNIQKIRDRLVLASAIIGASLVPACGGGGSGAAMGTVNVHLTDAPACGYEHVYVSVDHVELSSDANAWTTIPVSNAAQPIDLLNLSNGVMMSLGSAPLPAGTYQQVRLVLKSNKSSGGALANSVVLSGSAASVALDTPSAQQSGYKILGPLTVAPGSITDLVLDFNACKSIVAAGASGKYLLKPVVTATVQAMSGSISGFALPGSQVAAYAEPAGSFITGTFVPAGVGPSGQFNLGPILQTSATPGSSIDVVIVPPAQSGQATVIIQSVPVAAGETTWISPSDGSAPFNATPTTASAINAASGTVTVGLAAGVASLVASQTIASTGRTYEIARANSLATGSFSLNLAASGPWLGNYAGSVTTAPIPLTQDTASTDVGRYNIVASTALSTSAPQSVNVSTGSVTNLNFALSQ